MCFQQYGDYSGSKHTGWAIARKKDGNFALFNNGQEVNNDPAMFQEGMGLFRQALGLPATGHTPSTHGERSEFSRAAFSLMDQVRISRHHSKYGHGGKTVLQLPDGRHPNHKDHVMVNSGNQFVIKQDKGLNPQHKEISLDEHFKALRNDFVNDFVRRLGMAPRAITRLVTKKISISDDENSPGKSNEVHEKEVFLTVSKYISGREIQSRDKEKASKALLSIVQLTGATDIVDEKGIIQGNVIETPDGQMILEFYDDKKTHVKPPTLSGRKLAESLETTVKGLSNEINRALAHTLRRIDSSKFKPEEREQLVQRVTEHAQGMLQQLQN